MSDKVEGLGGQGVKILLPSLDFNTVKNNLTIFKAAWFDMYSEAIIHTLFLYMA